MPKRSSRQTKSDDDSSSGLNLSLHNTNQEADLSLHGTTNETDLSLHGTEHETDLSLHSAKLEAESGVYADSQQRSGSRSPEAQTFEGHPNAPTNSLLQREAKDVRPDWVGEDTSTDVPEPVQDVLSSSGRSFCRPIQRDIEQKMGESFGDVRIHTGAKAAEACDAVNARAFTAGNHIVFNSGEYNPGTPEGEYIIAHEMAHVKQQTGGALSLLPQADSELKVDPDPPLEREADQAAKEALSDGENPQIQSLPGTSTDVHIQRLPEDKVFEALAMFKDENESGDVGDFQEQQNQNRIAFLESVVEDMLDKDRLQNASDRQQERIQEAELDAETAKAYTNVDDDEVIEDIDDARTKGQLTERPEKLTEGQENIEAMVQELTQGISDKLDQVGLTDDQRQKLDTFDSGEFMKELGWTTVKGVLSLVPGLGPIIATYEIAETTLQEFWNQTNGSLAERLKQVKQAVMENVKTGEGSDPYQGGNS